MDKTNLHINGGKPLTGTLTPSANKNAVLPILCATILTQEPIHLENIPDITDARKLLDFFRVIGSKVDYDTASGTLDIQHKDLSSFDPAQIPSAMRSSVLLFAPLLHRLGKIRVHTNTKGCTLGVREIDPHIILLRAFGVSVDLSLSHISMTTNGRLEGMAHWFDYASVTATESFLMAAVVAKGTSTLTNAAAEPHVQDLCVFLQLMGAKITGIGTNCLHVEGVDDLHGCSFSMPDDHHEIATYLAIGAITGGHVRVRNRVQHHFPLLCQAFAKLGVDVVHDGEYSTNINSRPYKIKQPITENTFQKIEAAPWPYFPADLLPPFIALSTNCSGNVLFWNKVYEGGLSWIPELNKFGAFAHLSDPHKVIVIGNAPLHAATVESPYIIRAAIALLMMALSVPGMSKIEKAVPITRAHPKFVDNLRTLGADVEWN